MADSTQDLLSLIQGPAQQGDTVPPEQQVSQVRPDVLLQAMQRSNILANANNATNPPIVPVPQNIPSQITPQSIAAAQSAQQVQQNTIPQASPPLNYDTTSKALINALTSSFDNPLPPKVQGGLPAGAPAQNRQFGLLDVISAAARAQGTPAGQNTPTKLQAFEGWLSNFLGALGQGMAAAHGPGAALKGAGAAIQEPVQQRVLQQQLGIQQAEAQARIQQAQAQEEFNRQRAREYSMVTVAQIGPDGKPQYDKDGNVITTQILAKDAGAYYAKLGSAGVKAQAQLQAVQITAANKIDVEKMKVLVQQGEVAFTKPAKDENGREYVAAYNKFNQPLGAVDGAIPPESYLPKDRYTKNSDGSYSLTTTAPNLSGVGGGASTGTAPQTKATAPATPPPGINSAVWNALPQNLQQAILSTQTQAQQQPRTLLPAPVQGAVNQAQQSSKTKAAKGRAIVQQAASTPPPPISPQTEAAHIASVSTSPTTLNPAGPAVPGGQVVAKDPIAPLRAIAGTNPIAADAVSVFDGAERMEDVNPKTRSQVRSMLMKYGYTPQSSSASAPVYGQDAKTGQMYLTNRADAEKSGYQTIVPVTAAQYEKDRQNNNRLADVQRKMSEYRDSFNQTIDANDADAINFLTAHGELLPFLHMNSLEAINNRLKAEGVMGLSQAGLNRYIAFTNAKEALVGYNYLLSNSGRSNEKQLELAQAQLPPPNTDVSTGRAFMDQFQQNIDILGQGIPIVKGMKNAADIKAEYQKKEQDTQATEQRRNTGAAKTPQQITGTDFTSMAKQGQLVTAEQSGNGVVKLTDNKGKVYTYLTSYPAGYLQSAIDRENDRFK